MDQLDGFKWFFCVDQSLGMMASIATTHRMMRLVNDSQSNPPCGPFRVIAGMAFQASVAWTELSRTHGAGDVAGLALGADTPLWRDRHRPPTL